MEIPQWFCDKDKKGAPKAVAKGGLGSLVAPRRGASAATTTAPPPPPPPPPPPVAALARFELLRRAPVGRAPVPFLV